MLNVVVFFLFLYLFDSITVFLKELFESDFFHIGVTRSFEMFDNRLLALISCVAAGNDLGHEVEES